MKVVKQTAVLLTLQYRPMGFWLIGGGLIITGIGILICWNESTSLICHRQSITTGDCQQTVVCPLMKAYSNHWITYLLSSIFIIVGWIAFLRQVITVTFDKNRKYLIIEQRRISGIQTIQDLDNVTATQVELSWFLSQLVLVLKSGERIPLTSKSIGKINNHNLADKITGFLSNQC